MLPIRPDLSVSSFSPHRPRAFSAKVAIASWPKSSSPSPQASLAAVLVAVELVLESGAVNAEHLHNVLARLTPQPVMPTVDTALPVSEPPVADTARYDRLRTAATDHA